jgi:hypothetical protein
MLPDWRMGWGAGTRMCVVSEQHSSSAITHQWCMRQAVCACPCLVHTACCATTCPSCAMVADICASLRPSPLLLLPAIRLASTGKLFLGQCTARVLARVAV